MQTNGGKQQKEKEQKFLQENWMSTFYAMMGMIKNRNSEDPRETEDIKKRWQEYTEELNKKTS